MRILIADDQVLTREALRTVLEDCDHDFEVVAEAQDGCSALRLARECKPDLVLLDLDMPGMSGMEVTRSLTKALPEITVLVLDEREDDTQLFEAIRAGARGYLTRDLHCDRFLELVAAAGRGEPALTPRLAAKLLDAFAHTRDHGSRAKTHAGLTSREHDVLVLMARGVTSNRGLAHALNVSENTVRFHVRNILEKLHLHTRAAAVAYALTHGIVEGPQI